MHMTHRFIYYLSQPSPLTHKKEDYITVYDFKYLFDQDQN